jgi:hypothetical protein
LTQKPKLSPGFCQPTRRAPSQAYCYSIDCSNYRQEERYDNIRFIGGIVQQMRGILQIIECSIIFFFFSVFFCSQLNRPIIAQVGVSGSRLYTLLVRRFLAR